MENPGAVTFIDELLLLDPTTTSISQRRGQAATIAHELAHMWFGDLVTMSWWNDLWLNESFASWMGDKVTERLFPEFQIDLANRRGIQGLMSRDAHPSTKPIRREIETLATIFEDLGLAYGKGQTVLGMVEQWIGEDVLQAGIRSYLAEHAWGNAVAADLWSALSAASGKDLAPMLASFLNQAGLPLVTASLGGDGAVRLEQRRFLNEGVEAADQLWILPVRLRLSVDGRVESRTVVLDGATQEIAVDGSVDWVYPDDGAFGYLRWRVPPEMYLELAKGAGERLTPAERIAFLGNAQALLDAGVLSGGDYLGVLRAFSGDDEAEVVSAVISGIEQVSDQLVPPEAGDLFASYLRDSLSSAVDRFGLELRPGEPEAVSLFRPRLFTLLGDIGRDGEVRSRSARLTSAYLANVKAVDPALAGAALKVAAIEGDRGLFDTFRGRFESAETPIERDNFLGAMGYFGDPEIQVAALEYNLGGTVRPTELFTIPGSMARNEEGASRSFGWLLTSWDEITTRVPKMVLSFMPFFAGGCSTERLEAATEFFTVEAHQVSGTLNNLTKVTEQVTDCARLRERQAPSVLRYLRQEVEVAPPEDNRG
jgi:alanyl aminopeptidase